jgi:hypothetical protein
MIINQLINAAVMTLFITVSLAAENPVLKPAAEQSSGVTFERRIAGRADKIQDRLQLADPALAAQVRDALLQFYRDLHAVHEVRDKALAGMAAGDPHRTNRITFDADKQSFRIFGQLTGTLARLLDDKQVESVKDWMTFDMVSLSVDEYRRMFPKMNETQRDRIHAWLLESREAAVIAGSAETKLDVFRVNKMRMNAYLAAQGFDVESAVRAEDARKAAEKKPD